MCKRMDGYVSFANVEGLGEPPGLDIDGDAVEGAEGLRKWGKWFKRLPFVHASEGHPVPTQLVMVTHIQVRSLPAR